jgi:hypothetical protein
MVVHKAYCRYMLCPEDWRHLASIRFHTQVHKLFPFYPADLATLEAHGVNTVSQLSDTRLSGRIEKSESTDLMALLQPHPVI